MSTGHTFRPGDIATDGTDEVVVVSIHGVDVVVRAASGLTYKVNGVALGHVPVTAEHVGQWGRVVSGEGKGAVGRVDTSMDDGEVCVVDLDSCERSGPAVLVAQPAPAPARNLRPVPVSPGLPVVQGPQNSAQNFPPAHVVTTARALRRVGEALHRASDEHARLGDRDELEHSGLQTVFHRSWVSDLDPVRAFVGGVAPWGVGDGDERVLVALSREEHAAVVEFLAGRHHAAAQNAGA